jgi:hypothetical protein
MWSKSAAVCHGAPRCLCTGTPARWRTLLHQSQWHADTHTLPSAAAVLMVCGFVLAWQKFYKEDDEDLA